MKVIIRNAQELAEAKADLADLKKVWKKILTAQSYSAGDIQLQRASLARIESEIDDFTEAIAAYEETGSTRRRAKRMIPV